MLGFLDAQIDVCLVHVTYRIVSVHSASSLRFWTTAFRYIHRMAWSVNLLLNVGSQIRYSVWMVGMAVCAGSGSVLAIALRELDNSTKHGVLGRCLSPSRQ